jgi:hypothetical protein
LVFYFSAVSYGPNPYKFIQSIVGLSRFDITI